MPINHDDQESLKGIRARARDVNAQDEPLRDIPDAEVIAALIDGTVSLDNIDDETLERCLKTFGPNQFVRMLVKEKHTQVGDDPAPLGRLPVRPEMSRWRKNSHLMATAASIALVSIILIGAGMSMMDSMMNSIKQYVINDVVSGTGNTILQSSADHANGLTIAFQWPSHPPFDPGTVKPWGPTTPSLPLGLPDFTKESVTLGAGGEDQFAAWRLATVIIRTEEGMGSGAFISSDGWLLTTYHVVEGSVQQASMMGSVPTVDVIVGQQTEGRIKPRSAVKAHVYRVDPVHDVALIKLEALPDGMKNVPFFQLAADIRQGKECFVVGAQTKGQAWWVRSGTVLALFDFPKESNHKVGGGTSTDSSAERTRATMAVTDTLISSGDSGGPLLNTKGQLIGLTFAPHVNRTTDSVGWHIALKHLRGIVAELPSQPDGVPFDPWTIGMPSAHLATPQQADGDRDGRIDTLIFPYVADVTDSAGHRAQQAVAFTMFVDVSHKPKPRASDLMPVGLWSRERRGSFRYDIFITVRVDGKLVVGYTNENGIVDELRIGDAQTGKITVKWQRTNQGEWRPSWPSIGTPFLDGARISDDKRRQIGVIYQNLVADPS